MSGKFHLKKAGNGQVIGQSQMYTSASGCNLGMDSVKRHAPEALLLDETAL